MRSDYADATESARRGRKSKKIEPLTYKANQSGNRAATIQRSSARNTPHARAAARLSIASTPMPLSSSARTKARGGWRRAGPVPSSRNSGGGSIAKKSAKSVSVSCSGAGASLHRAARVGVSSSPSGKTSSLTRKPRPEKPVTIGPCPDSSRRSSIPARLSVRVAPHHRAAPCVQPAPRYSTCSPSFLQAVAKGRAR